MNLDIQAVQFRQVLAVLSPGLYSRRDAAFASGEALVLAYLSASAGPSDDAISGTSEAALITGGAGNDTLQARADDDRLYGGAGDDIHVIDDARDRIVETAGGGTDWVTVPPSTSRAPRLWRIFLCGVAPVSATAITAPTA